MEKFLKKVLGSKHQSSIFHPTLIKTEKAKTLLQRAKKGPTLWKSFWPQNLNLGNSFCTYRTQCRLHIVLRSFHDRYYKYLFDHAKKTTDRSCYWRSVVLERKTRNSWWKNKPEPLKKMRRKTRRKLSLFVLRKNKKPQNCGKTEIIYTHIIIFSCRLQQSTRRSFGLWVPRAKLFSFKSH